MKRKIKMNTVPIAIFWPRRKALKRNERIVQYMRQVKNERDTFGSFRISRNSFIWRAHIKPLAMPSEKRTTPADKDTKCRRSSVSSEGSFKNAGPGCLDLSCADCKR